MLKYYFSLILCISFVLSTSAQYISNVTIPNPNDKIITDENDPSVKYANMITAEELKAHLSVLASDAYEGRETGTKGNDKASRYIAKYYKSIDIPQGGPNGKSYFQPVAFTFSKWVDTDIFVNKQRYRHLWDYIAFPDQNDNNPVIHTNEVIYLGYGIDDPKYSDYNKNNVKGKVIMIHRGEPVKKDSTYHISGTKQKSDWTLEKKLETAKTHGVKLVLVIENDIQKMVTENRRKLLGYAISLGDLTKKKRKTANHVFISPELAQAILGNKEKKVIKSQKRANRKGKPCDVKVKTDFAINMAKEENVINSRNVLGIIPGTKKADEVVIVSAHYDHLGKKGDVIYNGADDNGSGTSTVLELAKAFRLASSGGFKPLRSIIFLSVTGEEKGLLGSRYYAQNPIYPLQNTVADVNIDMVGRQDEKYKDNPNYIYVIGSDRLSSDLHQIDENMNKKYSGLILDYTYNDEKDPNRYYYRSDHYNFARNGIPSIFFFNGVHADYHQPTDTIDKINFKKMEKIARHIFHVVWELANRQERIKVDGKV